MEVLAEELLAYAVEQKQAAQRYWRCWNTLSRRQKEVVVLISRGYSNQEIGRALVISVETAKTHVRNILYKFNLHRREHCVRRWRAGTSRIGTTWGEHPVSGCARSAVQCYFERDGAR